MPDPVRRSALEGHLHPHQPDGVSRAVLRERHPRAMAIILGAGDAVALAGALSVFGLSGELVAGRSAVGDGMSALWVGPGQYLVVSLRHDVIELEQSLATAVRPVGAVAVDLTHARTVFRITGPAATDLLAKGCPLDLEMMRAGDTAATVLGHFNIYLHRHDEGFDLYVFRSFGLSCLEWLQHAGREYAMRIHESS